MMPFQKSYSDTRPQNRQPWHRSKSNPTPRPQAPLPVSEVTKSKLNKFQYVPKAVDGNEGGEGSSTNASGDTVATPAARLKWQDLVEPAATIEDDTSPADRLLWDNRQQDPQYMAAISPMLARSRGRGRKRARSSSPASSPVAEFPKTPSVDVQKLAQALKTPHADPTLELWDRYSLGGPESLSSASGLTNPALANLMVSSSPRPKDATPTPGSTNLRRAVGNGLNWAKRRKMEKSRSAGHVTESMRDLEAASKSSLVTELLDTVSSSLHESSPHQLVRAEAQSPSPEKKTVPAAVPVPSTTKPTTRVEIASSDYGDDDFDDDAFMELEQSLSVPEPAGKKVVVVEEPKIRKSDSGSLIQEDDFDDLDDDAIFDEADPTTASLSQIPAPPPPKPTGPSPLVSISEDDFGDDFDMDDLDAVEMAATQSLKNTRISTPANSGKKKTIQRYLITKVLEGEFADPYGNHRPEKILLIQADGSKESRTVHLRGSWYDTPAHADSYVHVIGNFSMKGQCIISDAENLIILHPDQLISSTVVADSFGCMRRAVLQDRVKATSQPGPPLVYGTILHEIFQDAMLANQWDLPYLSTLIDKILEKHVEDLYTIKVSPAIAREHLQSKMTELSYWAKSFVSSEPKADALVEDRQGKAAKMAITKLLDVEEHVWSPMYGLKGNIDATVEVAILEGKQKRTLTVPFEVKTGKHANSSHIAQTALYTLLLSDRYDIDITYGILYYMETSKTMRIPAIRHELRHMVMQRNELACYIRERSVQLPPMLKNKHMCGKCYAQTACFIYHKLADDGDGETSGMNENFDKVIQHLTPRHQEFFVRWENLLTKEEKESMKNKRELWTMTSVEREKKSRCFADVVIEEGSASVDTETSRINRFHYAFVKRVHAPGFSFLESELNVGEPIVVSDEEGHFALAIGYVTAVRKQRISVAVDRRLHNARIRQPGFDEVDNQVFASIMEVAPEGSSVEQTQGKIKEAPIRYRLDQDEFSNGMATVRNNLVQMMSTETPSASKVRQLIVDMQAPRFKTMATQYSVTDGESLNVDQRRAIEKVMSAQDYALVLGMPGTGKTTTIAHIIRALVSQGKTVLLTSHTHTAVDNILLKLKDDKTPVLRLGAPAKIHPEVQEFAKLAGVPMKDAAEIKDAWHGTPIVATTCLGINHPVFLERHFDYCIVDEASQITLPICAGPIRMANTFVLVGDHNQLPPVVKNEEAKQGGLDVSLFKLLSDNHPQSVVNLEHQYRMCEDIMTLSNTLIYEGRLRCGYEGLKKRKLEVSNMKALRQHHYDTSTLGRHGTPRSFCMGSPSRCWLQDLIDPEARVRFINTDTVLPQVREEAQGKRIVNSSEVSIVSQLVESLLTVGVPAEEIGVMTHYRAQLFLLKEKLKHCSGVEMHTTDRFQGRDKEAIVLSLVRSNDACNIGDLLKDWRRINVAFTRAKTKLLVVGSMSTLKNSGKDNMLSQFIELMEQRQWIYHLPGDALESHWFDDFSTQTTAATQRVKTPAKVVKGRNEDGEDKENAGKKGANRPSPRRARVGEKVMLKGKLITRDILNEMTNGAY